MSVNNMKGQASMIDVLILGIFISILVVSTIYVGEQQNRAQAAREETFYSKSMMTALFNYNNETYGRHSNGENNFTFSEALAQLLCRYGNYRNLEDDGEKIDGLNLTAEEFLNTTVRPSFNYILLAQCGPKAIYVWNNQSNVCAERINKVAFDFKLPCDINQACRGKDKDGNEIIVYQQPFIGIWPEWQNLPPASDPSCKKK